MSADLNAIKARWAAATPYGWPWDAETLYLATGHEPKVQAIAHAPEDIATLLDLVERQYAQFQELNACIDRQGEALEEVRDALMTGNTYGGQVEASLDVLERRMGAAWLNGREGE